MAAAPSGVLMAPESPGDACMSKSTVRALAYWRVTRDCDLLRPDRDYSRRVSRVHLPIPISGGKHLPRSPPTTFCMDHLE